MRGGRRSLPNSWLEGLVRMVEQLEAALGARLAGCPTSPLRAL
ncbi:hypothetical protein ACWEFD_36220 [Streptomyces ardesiacus]|nr:MULTISPECIES: hypothetical protein [Streptomyces]